MTANAEVISLAPILELHRKHPHARIESVLSIYRRERVLMSLLLYRMENEIARAAERAARSSPEAARIVTKRETTGAWE